MHCHCSSGFSQVVPILDVEAYGSEGFRHSLEVTFCCFRVKPQSHSVPRSLSVAQALLTKSHQELEVDSLACDIGQSVWVFC